ncbi:AraC family transcriptional regulator, partial [Micromonospora deserti]
SSPPPAGAASPAPGADVPDAATGQATVPAPRGAGEPETVEISAGPP